MLIQPINYNSCNTFGKNFKLSEDSIKAIESSTGLTYKEMTNLPLEESVKLMKKRGKLKEPSKIKIWISNLYRKIGEELGLLEKRYNIYTDVD